MDRIKVFQFSFGDGFAGSAKMALLCSEVLLKKDFDVTLFASKNSLTASRAKLKNLPLVELDSSQKFKPLINQIIDRAEKEIPNIIISYHSLDRKSVLLLSESIVRRL